MVSSKPTAVAGSHSRVDFIFYCDRTDNSEGFDCDRTDNRLHAEYFSFLLPSGLFMFQVSGMECVEPSRTGFEMW